MIKPLNTEFEGRGSQKGYSFRCLKREKNIAIYEKMAEDGDSYYELVIVKHHNGLKFGDSIVPPSEFYPSDNQFGLDGWCYRKDQKEKMEEKFQKLLIEKENASS